MIAGVLLQLTGADCMAHCCARFAQAFRLLELFDLSRRAAQRVGLPAQALHLLAAAAWGANAAGRAEALRSRRSRCGGFIFEYLFGVYIQVYLITVCLAWIKGLTSARKQLLRFAMRRFSYVLKWAGVVIVVSTLMVRLPLLLAYFRNIPGVLDYLPRRRCVMSVLIILFGSMQISLVLHNESLREASARIGNFSGDNTVRLAWFLFIGALHFFLLPGR